MTVNVFLKTYGITIQKFAKNCQIPLSMAKKAARGELDDQMIADTITRVTGGLIRPDEMCFDLEREDGTPVLHSPLRDPEGQTNVYFLPNQYQLTPKQMAAFQLCLFTADWKTIRSVVTFLRVDRTSIRKTAYSLDIGLSSSQQWKKEGEIIFQEYLDRVTAMTQPMIIEKKPKRPTTHSFEEDDDALDDL